LYLVYFNVGKFKSTSLGCQSTRHRSTRHRVDSSHSRLVTKRRWTRHKQTKHQSRTATAV